MDADGNYLPGGINGCDLVARSGGKNAAEFEKRMRSELQDYDEWCSCDFSVHYTCTSDRILHGLKHRTYGCSACKKDCAIRVLARSQMLDADRNPVKWNPSVTHKQERVQSHTSVGVPSTINPDETDIHLHNRKYKLTGVPFLRSSTWLR